jgi:MFS family permease
MVAGRLGGAHLARVVSVDALLLASLAVNAAGFALLWLSVTPALALVGIVTCGFGMALQFPLSLTRAVTASLGRPDQAMARISIGEGLATGLGPLSLSLLADAVGIHLAFLLVPALLTVAALGVTARKVPAVPVRP